MPDAATKQPPTAPRALMLRLNVGEVVQHRDAAWKIDGLIDLESVLATNTANDRKAVLPIKELKGLPENQAPAQPPKALDGISDRDWAIAKKRFDAIKPLLDLRGRSRRDVAKRAAEVGQDAATLYRWRRRYTACNDITALIPKTRGWEPGRRRIDAAADAIIEKAINDSYLSHRRPSAQELIAIVQGKCLKTGIDCPSDGTIRARIAEIPERQRLQRRGFGKQSRAKFQPTPGHFPDTADHPLAYVQIDHTPADIILVDDTHRRPIGRPWLTVAIDVYSRVVTGCHLSLDPPSETSVALCVAQSVVPKDQLLLEHKVDDAMWPVWGFPKTIHVDNAGEFRSNNFKNSCRSEGIDVEFRPVKRPEYGAHIERLIGTFMTEVHNLPGTTYSSPAEKGDLNPEKLAAMTFSEFEHWLFGYLCNIYHRKIHSGIGVPPLTKWEDGCLKGTADRPAPGLPPRPENTSDILRDFLPRFERVVHNSGVEIDSVRYYGEALNPWINATDPKDRRRKRKLVFRRDPRDISKIWFHDPEQDAYFELPASDRRFPHTNIWELRQAKRAMKERGEKLVDQAQLIQNLDQLRVEVDAAVSRTKKARRQKQRHKEHQRKTASEVAQTAAQAFQKPTSTTVDPLADLPDEEPEGFETW